MTGNGLEAVPAFMNKIIQLFDTFNVRFGVTVVGPAGAGKTTCYQQLQQAMTRLHDDAGSTTNALYRGVQTSVLNPKCITMGELYGEFHPMTQEWHDGLASTIMREAVQDTSTDDIKWTVFDGPIDALWIENMNTVLDDNMTLCLANGERIKLRQEMRMLFEVMDLAVASPATVSRIGVVYMTPADLGWRPYANSWMARLELPDSCIARLEENIHRHLQMGLDYLRKFGTEPVPTQDINIIMSFCRLFGSLVSRLMKVENDAPPVELTLTQMDVLFVFSFVWYVVNSWTLSCIIISTHPTNSCVYTILGLWVERWRLRVDLPLVPFVKTFFLPENASRSSRVTVPTSLVSCPTPRVCAVRGPKSCLNLATAKRCRFSISSCRHRTMFAIRFY